MATTPLTILYRGPLRACNYACAYCPFAKTAADDAMQTADRQALERFVAWVGEHVDWAIRVFFTPWGEALTYPWYHQAIARLSAQACVSRVAIQTNLSGPLDWLRGCDVPKLGFWCTYHPDHVSQAAFTRQLAELRTAGVRHSVGMVGLPRFVPTIESLRQALPPEVYLWVNACRREPLTPEERLRVQAVDPLFGFSRAHPSRGKACDCGHTVVAVDGDGDVCRCHFVDQPLGNLYRDDLAARLRPRPCPNAECWCHIGYVHLPTLGLRERFGDGILERVPCGQFPSAPL